MKFYFVIFFSLIAISLFAQCSNIEAGFYSKKAERITDWNELQTFWKNEIKILETKLVTEKSDPEIYYKLAIGTYNTEIQKAEKSINLLNKSINLNPNEPKYYAVRGLVYYCIRLNSDDELFRQSCIDVWKAIELGLSTELQKVILYN